VVGTVARTAGVQIVFPIEYVFGIEVFGPVMLNLIGG
jgi:hypothetical protein